MSPYGRSDPLRYHFAADVSVWLAYASFAAVVCVVFYNLRRIIPVAGLSLAFFLFFLGEATRHSMVNYDPGYAGTWLPLCLKILDGAIAAATAFALPSYYRRLRALMDRASASARDESRLVAAMHNTLDAVLMHDAVRGATGKIVDFRCVYLNPNAEAMMGRPRTELIGELASELYPAAMASGQFALYCGVIETGEPAVFDTETALLNGGRGRSSSLIRVQVVKLEDGILTTCVDVTAERVTTQELKRSLAYNKAIVSSSFFSIIMTELDGTISSVNPAAEEMLGYAAEELKGKDIAMLHDPVELVSRSRQLAEELGRAVPPDSSVLRARLQAGLEEDREWTYMCRNDLRLPVQVHVNAVEDEAGETIAYMATSYDLTDRKQTDQYIYHIAHHDPLTGLPGRALLRERLELAIEMGERTRELFAVLIFDLDHFKRINDSLGHDIGDIVLREVAYRLRSSVRKVDTVARFGGDEFVVLLNGVDDRSEAEVVARKLRDAFSVPVHAGGQNIEITASIGLSLYPESSTSDELLKHADIALYHGKTGGRSGLAVFTPALGKTLLDKLRLESALRRALDDGEFFLVYQPQISLTDHTLIGVEALVRWRSADAGLIMPNIFIPVAEESGLIIPIGAWVLETACREIAALQKECGYKLSVAVNLSPNQVHGANFQGTIERALEVSGLDPTSLEVEITEGLLMRDSEEALQIIEGIQALGVTTAIDDFGTGFSNMSYITRFKVDRLKIDRSFVSRCLTDANSLAVTTAIIALAHSLNMEVVAEGVETTEQAFMLRDLECDSAQGYLYAKPLSLKEVTEYTRELCNFGANAESRSQWMYGEKVGDLPVVVGVPEVQGIG